MSRLLTPDEREAFEHRKRIALAQLGVAIDVMSGWRGAYEDDERPACIDWILAVIPEIEKEPTMRGWLCVRNTATPGLGWYINERGGFSICSLCRSFRGHGWPVSRKLFRLAANRSDVSLPSIHATYYLDQDKRKAEAQAEWELSNRLVGRHGYYGIVERIEIEKKQRRLFA